jgi:zinc protease
MNTADRIKAPQINPIKKLEVIQPILYILGNKIPVYSINAGTQDVIKIDLIFAAGSFFQPRKLVAQFVNKMLIEGTTTLSADAIADMFDYYGAYVHTEVEKDKAYVTLYCLNKHLSHVLPVFEDIIKNAVFPENEFSIYLQNQKQQHIINTQKVNYIARIKFPALLFGEQHPYGAAAETDDFASLKRQHLLQFYESFYKANNCKIIISGKTSEEHIRLLETHFGGSDWISKETIEERSFEITPSSKNKNFILKEDALQSALRIGRLMVNKKHSDYFGLQILNTILGGYFGSRLMNNIREDKGYTYGIGSGLISFLHAGFFYIASEVGTDVCSKAIEEIYKELKILRTDLISDTELNLVRNYMLGNLMRIADGPFALSDRFRGLLEYDLNEDYYISFVDTINNISPAQLLDLAGKYLQEDAMFELVVGKNN